MIDDIYSRAPINKAAALSVGQSGCEDEESLEYKRDSLARALDCIQREISGLPKKHKHRKELGIKKLDMQVEIRIINQKIKLKNLMDHDIDNYLLTECKRSMTTAKWNELRCKARAAKEEEISLQKSKLREIQR